jgi:hypothetical protein
MTKIRRNLPNNQYLAALLANSPSSTNVYATMADLVGLGGGTISAASRVQHDVKYGEQINIGQAVYVSSADGTNMIVSKASNTTDMLSARTMGLVTATGNTNYQGSVVTEGLLEGLDTSLAMNGDPVWLGANGNLLYGFVNKPYAPTHLVFIGIVTRVNANNGEIFVKVQNGFEIEELHDVSITGRLNNFVLGYNSTSGLHEFKSITTWLGYTPVNETRTISTTGPLSGGGNLSANRTLSIALATASTDGYLASTDWVIFNNKVATTRAVNVSAPLTGGGDLSSDKTIGITKATSTVDGYLAATDWVIFNAKQSELGFTPANKAGDTFTGNISALNLSGTNSGDETTSTIKTKLGAASASQDGYLTQADWSTFNGKQNTLTYTPADKAGEAFTGNITASNLSGTNTGDETTSTIKTKLGVASTTTDGYLITADWNTFNNKVATTRTISTTSPLQGGGDLSSNRTLSIIQAGVTTDGFLSAVDWNTFNNKQNPIGYTPENISNKSTDVNLGTSNTLYPTQNAVKVYTDNLLGNANALVYKGVIDCSSNPDYPAANAGELYIASVAGKIGGASGTSVEPGDMIICNTDSTVTGTQAAVGTYWNIIQKNIEGAVTGPASSITNNVAFFDGTTGKIIKDSGLTLSGTNTGDETATTIKTKLNPASVSNDGYLSSTDWTTFNNKQAALVSGTNIKTINTFSLLGSGNINVQGVITLTTIGSSGAATFDGTTLNIPQYTGGSGSATFDYGLANAMTTMTFL